VAKNVLPFVFVIISYAQDCFEITKEGKTGSVIWWSK
jgi:hypothetical protein